MPTSGRQRNYALAMGIESNADSDGKALSNAMEKAKVTLKGRPNSKQLALAARWRLDVAPNATGWHVVDQLYPVIQARSFVYSVIRRIAGAKWQFYGQTGINDAWVDEVAILLNADQESRDFIMGMENTTSGTLADAWYRFGKRQWESDVVQSVAVAVKRDLPPEYLSGSTLPARSPRPRGRRKQSTGCAVLLAMIGAVIAVAWAWESLINGH